jgi:hypothetical protein
VITCITPSQMRVEIKTESGWITSGMSEATAINGSDPEDDAPRSLPSTKQQRGNGSDLRCNHRQQQDREPGNQLESGNGLNFHRHPKQASDAIDEKGQQPRPHTGDQGGVGHGPNPGVGGRGG